MSHDPDHGGWHARPHHHGVVDATIISSQRGLSAVDESCLGVTSAGQTDCAGTRSRGQRRSAGAGMLVPAPPTFSDAAELAGLNCVH